MTCEECQVPKPEVQMVDREVPKIIVQAEEKIVEVPQAVSCYFLKAFITVVICKVSVLFKLFIYGVLFF